MPDYQIRLGVRLDGRWAAWFDGLAIAHDEARGETILRGPIADQAALHGVLATVRDLGLPLVGVSLAAPDGHEEGGDGGAAAD